MSKDKIDQDHMLGQRTLSRLIVRVQEDNHLPARNPVRRTCGRVVGHYPSTKTDRMVGWESQLEEKACAVFEFSPAVKAYTEQPEEFQLLVNGKLTRYTPDFMITLFDDCCVFIEVKPLKYLEKSEVKEKLKLFAQHFRRNSSDLIALTEVELENPTLQCNLCLLRQYLRVDIGKSAENKAKQLVNLASSISLSRLSNELGSKATAYALLANHILTFNFEQELSPETLVFHPTENHHVTTLFSNRRVY